MCKIKWVKKLLGWYKNFNELVPIWNKEFVGRELLEQEQLLSNIDGKSLDLHQPFIINSSNEFEEWPNKLNLTDNAKNEVQHVRQSPPARRVGGGKHNVSGRYSSKKMGVTIQFESHKVELPTIYMLEYNERGTYGGRGLADGYKIYDTFKTI